MCPESESMATVQLKNIKKVYPFISGEQKKNKKKADEPEKKKVNLQITDEGVVAVQAFDLDIADKEFIVLVGPSGCGKSTTLRMVAGLEEISGGQLIIDGKVMNDVAPKDRDIAMVFQNYALYPHMTVYENMAFSLKLRKEPKDVIDKKVREAAEILDITQYLERSSASPRHSPAASASASPSAAPSCVIRRSCSWTSLSVTSTQSSETKCAPRSSSSASASTPPSCTSPMTRPRP